MENWAIFLTVINTGIAAISCFFAWLSAKASRDQIQESQKANVVVSFECVKQEDICLKIQNLGGSVAQFVSLEFEENLLKVLGEHERTTLENLQIPRLTLGINQSVYFILGTIHDFDKIENLLTHITVQYRDNSNKNKKKGYVEKYTLDFSGYNRSKIYTSPEDDIAHSLNQIQNRLYSMPINGTIIQPLTRWGSPKEL